MTSLEEQAPSNLEVNPSVHGDESFPVLNVDVPSKQQDGERRREGRVT